MSAGLPTDARGVVQIELLLVIVPLFLLLVGLTQLVLLQVAQLVVQHAAQRGVRSAIVILNDTSDAYHGAAPGEIGGVGGRPYSARYRAIERAVRWPLRALDASPQPSVSFPVAEGSADTHQGSVPIDGQVHLRVEQRFKCRIPLARNLICDPASKLPFDPRRVIMLQSEATLPSQWASYDAEQRDAR
jgi:hypothetical protein